LLVTSSISNKTLTSRSGQRFSSSREFGKEAVLHVVGFILESFWMQSAPTWWLVKQQALSADEGASASIVEANGRLLKLLEEGGRGSEPVPFRHLFEGKRLNSHMPSSAGRGCS
jgi:hypothetical protein